MPGSVSRHTRAWTTAPSGRALAEADSHGASTLHATPATLPSSPRDRRAKSACWCRALASAPGSALPASRRAVPAGNAAPVGASPNSSDSRSAGGGPAAAPGRTHSGAPCTAATASGDSTSVAAESPTAVTWACTRPQPKLRSVFCLDRYAVKEGVNHLRTPAGARANTATRLAWRRKASPALPPLSNASSKDTKSPTATSQPLAASTAPAVSPTGRVGGASPLAEVAW